jgi:hypothetical protein
MERNVIFDPINLDPDRCFLCAVPLNDDNRTDEHVFPKWLQHKTGLWNQELTLLNKTSIPYRRLTIPCCSKCNNTHLSALENEIRGSMEKGFEAFSKVDEARVFQWCSKILYGLLYKQYFLALDRREPTKGSIVPREFLEGIRMFHLFLQSIRRPFEFVDYPPYSVFVFKMRTFKTKEENFDYIDSIFLRYRFAPCLAIRLNDVGIICVFQDDGHQKHILQHKYDAFGGHPIHPLQFVELVCRHVYKHSLLNYVPSYRIATTVHDDSPVQIMRVGNMPEDVWREWDNQEFGQYFFSMLQKYPQYGGATSLETIYQPGTGEVISYLELRDGRPLKFGADGRPVTD